MQNIGHLHRRLLPAASRCRWCLASLPLLGVRARPRRSPSPPCSTHCFTTSSSSSALPPSSPSFEANLRPTTSELSSSYPSGANGAGSPGRRSRPQGCPEGRRRGGEAAPLGTPQTAPTNIFGFCRLTCAFARFAFFEKCKKGFAFACAVGCAGHCLRCRAVLRDLLPLGVVRNEGTGALAHRSAARPLPESLPNE